MGTSGGGSITRGTYSQLRGAGISYPSGYHRAETSSAMRYESRNRRATEVGRRQHGGEPEFWVLREHEGSGYVLSLYGELDVASGPELEKQIKRLQWAGAA